MLLGSPAIEALVEAFRRLPGVGKRSAERMALHLLSAPAEESTILSEAIERARGQVTLCSRCCNLTEQDPCTVCVDERRDDRVVCVVERPAGTMAIERGGAFRGKYHVLHGVLNPLEGIGPSELRIEQLLRRLGSEPIEEVIIATNATAEGEATALYLSRLLAPKGVRISRIAHGVPMGSGLEFADDATLAHALEGRVHFH
jgi:recombination protein RecR